MLVHSVTCKNIFSCLFVVFWSCFFLIKKFIPGEMGPKIMRIEMNARKLTIASRSPQLIDPSRNVVTPQQHRLTSQQPIVSLWLDCQNFHCLSNNKFNLYWQNFHLIDISQLFRPWNFLDKILIDFTATIFTCFTTIRFFDKVLSDF